MSEFDRPSAIAASITVAVVGWAVFMGLPILVGALVEFRGFSEEQVGYLASADLGGMFISSVLVSLFVSRMDRRFWITLGIIVAIAADIAAMYADSFAAMLSVRIIAGIGAGFCYSLALANIAASTKNARNFSYLIFVLVSVNFFELYSLEVISDHWGVEGIFFTFALLNIFCLTAVWFLPRGTQQVASPATLTAEARPIQEHAYNLPLLGIACLVAIASFYLMIGAFWAYIERMGVSAGFDDNFIAAALSVTTLLSIAGCYIAYLVSQRQGQSKPIIVAPLGIALILFWLGQHTVAFTFVAVLMIYQLLWNGIDIFQLGTLANIDHSGRFIALVPAAQGLGQAIGPSVAGYMVGQGATYTAVMNLCAVAAIVTSAIYFFVYLQLKRAAPGIAEAR